MITLYPVFLSFSFIPSLLPPFFSSLYLFFLPSFLSPFRSYYIRCFYLLGESCLTFSYALTFFQLNAYYARSGTQQVTMRLRVDGLSPSGTVFSLISANLSFYFCQLKRINKFENFMEINAVRNGKLSKRENGNHSIYSNTSLFRHASCSSEMKTPLKCTIDLL